MRSIYADPPPLGFMGLCYGRSPLSGAGREAAGYTSRNSSHSGVDPPPAQLNFLRIVPQIFINDINSRYADSGPDDTYISDVDDDIDDNRSIPPNSREEISHMEVPCGYQDRRALRGSHRGRRSESSRARRFVSWKQQQRTSR